MTSRLLTTFLFCAILLITNRWLTYEEGISILKAADTHSYMTIAQAAPGFPQAANLPTNHTARFVLPYCIGTVAHFTGIAHERVFLVATLLFCGLIVLICDRIFRHLRLNNIQYAVSMALLVFNPYTFRYYLAVPAMMNDMVFVAGLAIVLWGLLRGHLRTVLAGGFVAILGRQNAIVFLPALLMWLAFGTAWNQVSWGTRLVRGAMTIAVIVVPYIIIGRIIASFSVQGMESEALTGIVLWAKSDSPGKMKVLAEFGLRTVICLLFPLLMMITTIITASMVDSTQSVFRALKNILLELPREFWLALLFVAALYGFAVLGGPELFMTGVTRYVSHAQIALLIALGVVMRRFHLFENIADESKILQLLGIVVVIVVGSFHHMTTFGGTTSDKAMYFAVIYCTLAIFAGALTFALARRTAGKE